MNGYWIDSDALIQSANGPYQFAFAPGFWTLVEKAVKSGDLCSAREVYNEIRRKDDTVFKWLQILGSSHFQMPDASVQGFYSEISNFVADNYSDPYVGEFLAGADPWLIAHAMRHGGAVVTREKRLNQPAKKVKIPNVCKQFRVPCINVPDLIIKLKGKLILDGSQ